MSLCYICGCFGCMCLWEGGEVEYLDIENWIVFIVWMKVGFKKKLCFKKKERKKERIVVCKRLFIKMICWGVDIC